ncbi:hypothetical protein D8B26_003414 [Coccidioides posadasii str. Silveira]|uniref:uncharacterized protein n=1 Tax=Coccidioides posadasii (strain RMSCC 757 / Silveira) TaxID=443226 RepID=UPI001BEE6F8B|nr:hypothetical protein D8B26_003414 [Coccidioides posadasii str. Silveira]
MSPEHLIIGAGVLSWISRQMATSEKQSSSQRATKKCSTRYDWPASRSLLCPVLSLPPSSLPRSLLVCPHPPFPSSRKGAGTCKESYDGALEFWLARHRVENAAYGGAGGEMQLPWGSTLHPSLPTTIQVAARISLGSARVSLCVCMCVEAG